VMTFPVDSSGRMRQYRIPVGRNAEWKGTVSRVELRYRGDTVKLEKVRFDLYPDVARALRSVGAGPGARDPERRDPAGRGVLPDSSATVAAAIE
jgi:hypothetical protein